MPYQWEVQFKKDGPTKRNKWNGCGVYSSRSDALENLKRLIRYKWGRKWIFRIVRQNLQSKSTTHPTTEGEITHMRQSRLSKPGDLDSA